MSHPDEPISVVEDLDPEPSPRRAKDEGRSGQAWELVLGLVLLVGVLTFAAWQWLRQNQQQAAYAAGSQALQRQDLDVAEGYFSTASGYLDADKQATQIADNIALRDDQYGKAVANQKNGNWAACLKSIQLVTAIEPGYKDTARIEQQAAEQVYRDAMSGTIALRPNADPPGLYYYTGDRWAWLPQSDGDSQVRGESADGWIAYDVRGNGAVPSPSHTPAFGVPGPSELAGRRFVAVRLSNFSDLKQISFDPSQYNLQLVGSRGVWAVGYNSGISYEPLPVRSRYLGTEHGSLIAYQSYQSAVTGVINVPLSTRYNTAIMALDPGSNRYLAAEWVHAYPGGMAGPNTTTNLYLESTGGSKQLLYTLNGGSFISAQFSPDGRRALVATYAPQAPGAETQAIVLLDLQGSTPPLTLSQITAQVDTNPFADPRDASRVTAAFIEDGPFSGKIVVAQYDGQQNRLQVMGAEKGQDPYINLLIPSDRKIIWTLHPGNNHISLLSGQEIVPSGYGLVEVPLWFATLSDDRPPALTRLRTLINNYLQYARLAGDTLSYSTYELGQNGRDMRSVFSFPIRRFGAIGENAWTMFTQEESMDGNDLFSFGDYSLGPSLLAYVSDGDLHARLYDGSVDVVLEHRITYLYDTYLHRINDGRLR